MINVMNKIESSIRGWEMLYSMKEDVGLTETLTFGQDLQKEGNEHVDWYSEPGSDMPETRPQDSSMPLVQDFKVFSGLQVVAHPNAQTQKAFSPSSYLVHGPLALSLATGLSCSGRPWDTCPFHAMKHVKYTRCVPATCISRGKLTKHIGLRRNKNSTWCKPILCHTQLNRI